MIGSKHVIFYRYQLGITSLQFFLCLIVIELISRAYEIYKLIMP